MKYILHLIFILIMFQSLNASSELKKVTLQLSWFDQFQFAGYYMAKEKGFYKRLGLDVEIKPFKFGMNIPQEIATNKIDFAIGRETLVLEKVKYKDIVALYAIFQSSPLVLLSTQESKIDTLSDFQNKKIMTTIDDASEVSLKAMLNSHKINFKDLVFLKHSHNIDDLITKKTDIISAYISKSPYLLQQQSIKYNIFEPKTYGFDMYSDFLYTNKNLISNDLKTVRAFKKASLLGWEYAYSNMDETVKIIQQQYNSQKLSKDELLFEAKELKKLSFLDTNILGDIDKNKIKRIVDLYNIMGLLKKPINIDDFIYNEDIDNLQLSPLQKQYLKKKKKITMCISPDWMPYEAFDSKGNHIGMSADYFQIFQKHIKIPIETIHTRTWSESISFIKSGKCDILSLAMKTKQRDKYLSYSEPYINTSYVLATKPQRSFINDLKNVKNVKIGVLRNSAFNETLQNKYPLITLVNVDTMEIGLQKVANGELFGFIDSFATIGHLLQNKFYSELHIAGKFEENFTIGVAARFDDQILLNIINSIIQNLSFETKQAIFNKWISINYKEAINYKTIWKFIIIFVILLTILIIIYKQHLLKTLNKELHEQVEKEVEKNIQQHELLAQQSKMVAMGEMIANIAHQWRQPLSVISTSATGMKLEKELGLLSDETFNKRCESINQNAQYLSSTIDDFRNFIKGDRTKEVFNLTDNINSFLHLIEGTIKKNEITIVLDLNNDLEISGYKNELMQCFINIFNNSKDILHEDNPNDKFIFISTFMKDNNIIITIKDNAGGIPTQILPRIFEPYFTTKYKSQGTGLGLHIAYNLIVDGMKGTIVASNVEYEHNNVKYKGALFTITLPLD